ncbi:hypothetical protein Ddc_19103 [Ditylenchus destructor]|nr:hypothetical protein Ddc_19103 [Ditylenchus destructor]
MEEVASVRDLFCLFSAIDALFLSPAICHHSPMKCSLPLFELVCGTQKRQCKGLERREDLCLPVISHWVWLPCGVSLDILGVYHDTVDFGVYHCVSKCIIAQPYSDPELRRRQT